MHVKSEPNILYFGTPVALLSTVNDDGSINLAPMSSIFFLSWRCMLGLRSSSKTCENLRRTRQLVVNLPSVDQAMAVDRLAKTTGTFPVPQDKLDRGFHYEKHKFEAAGLTPMPSEIVGAPRVRECPVQLEAVLVSERHLDEGGALDGFISTFEILVKRVHVDEAILMEGHPNRVDPDKWRPLMFSFQEFYGFGPRILLASTLGQIPETMYRTPDTGGKALAA